MSESIFSIPLWLILFMTAGFLLFVLKISSGSEPTETKRVVSLRLFLMVATVILILAGLIHFYHWAQP